ncbi:MAG: 50S ribosomal protein L3 [Actinobacteria bacterium]|nr:50S ribosomal protein L3 [Actinomycetota bacterium]MCL6087275.1 50S ribosomal protein L3 [Actinomycetota bacterium]
MVQAIYGKKIGSTQIYDENGNVLCVTAIEAEPCKVMQIKNVESDGYNALKVGFGAVKEKRLSKPKKGEFTKAKIESAKYMREIRLDDFNSQYKVGDSIDVSIFNVGDIVKITGISRGKGFAGVIKKYHFHRGPVTHGSHSIRRTGSVGMCSTPKKVMKGKKMPGRMGGIKVTAPGTKIVDILSEQNLILIKGSVPGAKGTLVYVRKA